MHITNSLTMLLHLSHTAHRFCAIVFVIALHFCRAWSWLSVCAHLQHIAIETVCVAAHTIVLAAPGHTTDDDNILIHLHVNFFLSHIIQMFFEWEWMSCYSCDLVFFLVFLLPSSSASIRMNKWLVVVVVVVLQFILLFLALIFGVRLAHTTPSVDLLFCSLFCCCCNSIPKVPYRRILIRSDCD